MGSQISRINGASSAPHLPPPSSPPPPSRTISDPTSNTSSTPNLTSYESACLTDPDLRNFDSKIHKNTTRTLNSIAMNLDSRTLSLDSLSQVTESLLSMNTEVVKIILQNKRDIWDNKDLSDLVDDYFENSLFTLHFCTTLSSVLTRASHLESLLNVIVSTFEHEHANNVRDGNAGYDYPKTLRELKSFTVSGDPFGQEFFKFFDSVRTRQIGMLEKLQVKKRRLDKKLRKLKGYKKVCNVIFVVAFASVLITSVVAAAITAPPVVTALAAVIPLGSMGKWVNSIWSKWERELRGERDIVSGMEIGSYIVIKDLDSIRVLVERFKIAVEGLVANAEFAERGEEAVAVAVEDIRKKVDGFVKIIRDLSENADKCTQETRMARTLILRRIMNHPSGGSSSQDIGMFS